MRRHNLRRIPCFWLLLLLPACGSAGRKTSSPAIQCADGDASCFGRQAFAENEKACDGGDQSGCAKLAAQHYAGIGVSPDKKRAIEVATAACDKVSGLACSELGLWLIDNEPANLDRFFPYFVKACDLGDGSGCSNLGNSYLMGYGVAKDEAKALPLLEKSCKLDYPGGCTNLGIYFATRGQPDDDRALAAFERGCELGDGQACSNLGDFHSNGRGTGSNAEKAMPIYQKACDLGNGYACATLALAVASGERGLTADPAKAISLFEKSCKLKEGSSCANLGRLYVLGEGGVTKDVAKGVELLTRGCELENGMSCTILGVVYTEGVGVNVDKAKAKNLFERACKLGVTDACDVQ